VIVSAWADVRSHVRVPPLPITALLARPLKATLMSAGSASVYVKGMVSVSSLAQVPPRVTVMSAPPKPSRSMSSVSSTLVVP